MAFTHVITNAVTVIKALGYKEGDHRRPVEDQAEGGADRCFQVTATPAVDMHPQHGISTNTRLATLHVRLGFAAGGGDMGGAARGGDRKDVNARAWEECRAIAARLENQDSYDAQNTGIRRRFNPRWDEVANAARSETWELVMAVEWDEALKAGAVAA